MDPTREEPFLVPNSRTLTRSQSKLPLSYSDSSGGEDDNSFFTDDISNKPQDIIKHPSTPRRTRSASSKEASSSDIETSFVNTLPNKGPSASASSSKDNRSTSLKIKKSRKAVGICNSQNNSSANTSTDEDETYQSGLEPKRKPTKASSKSSVNQKTKGVAKLRQTRKKHQSKNSLNKTTPDVFLRQNARASLIAFDNSINNNETTTENNTPRRGLIGHSASKATNTWDKLQFLEIQQPNVVQNLSNDQPSSSYHFFVVIDNKVFRFDTEVPEEIQQISSPFYTNANGDSVSQENLSEDVCSFEELTRIPMKMSKFYSLNGVYLGHKKLNEDNKRRIKRKKFKESQVSDSFYIYCRTCKNLKSCGGGSLTNFSRHLQEKHGLVDPAKMNLGVINVNEEGIITYGSSERYKWDNTRQLIGIDLLLQFMMDANLPFSNIEKFSLKRLLNFFDPHFVLPSKTTLSSLLSKKVEVEVVPNLKKSLENVNSSALVADIWSSKSLQGVLALSIIFLDQNFQWNQKTISVCRIIGSHTAENITQRILSVLKYWDLEGKVSFIVSDGGSNMVKSLFELHEIALSSFPSNAVSNNTKLPDIMEGASQNYYICDDTNSVNPPMENSDGNVATVSVGNVQFSTDFCFEGDQEIASAIFKDSDLTRTDDLSKLDEFLFEENLKPSKCIAHTLQRVLADGIQQDEKASKIQIVIKKVAAFGRKRQVIRETTKAMVGKVAQRPCTTRWNSTIDSGWTLWEPDFFDLIRTLIDDERAKASDKMLERLPESLSDEFYDQMEEFLRISNPVCVLTDKLQANGITAHLAIPGIAEAHEEITNLGEMKYLENYRKIILKSFETRMQQFVNDKEFILATVLCPYYKLKFSELYFKENPELNPLQMPSEDFVKELCFSHLRTCEEMEPSFTRNSTAPTSTAAIRCNFAQRLLEEESLKIHSQDSSKSDLAKYLAMGLSSESPADFWLKQKGENGLPRLYIKAREILCKPATSGLVERLFSLIADINTLNRVNLNIKTMEEIVLYKEFLNLPKSYKEATENIFNADDEQVCKMVQQLSLNNCQKPKVLKKSSKPSTSSKPSS